MPPVYPTPGQVLNGVPYGPTGAEFTGTLGGPVSGSGPILEQIAAAIAARLATITAANGYAVTVDSVVRPKRSGEGFCPRDYGVALLQDAAPNAPELVLSAGSQGVTIEQWRQRFTVDLVCRVSDGSATAVDTLLNQFLAEVQRAIWLDESWGGLALNTEAAGTEYPAVGAAQEGVSLLLDVIYRVRQGNPYVQG